MQKKPHNEAIAPKCAFIAVILLWVTYVTKDIETRSGIKLAFPNPLNKAICNPEYIRHEI
jgi:hypothetical protein